jgi:hypothetical protein
MFAQHHDTTTLRQGDIIEDVCFPLSRIQATLKFLGTLKPGVSPQVELIPDTERIGKSSFLTAQISVVPSFCMVLSQDCDVDRTQNPPPPSFAMCRLVPVPEKIKKDPTLFERLRLNIDPYGGERPFYQLFYVGSHSRLGSGEYVADYGMPMALAWTDYNALLKRKILELDDHSRAKFRVKAGAYFARPAQEDVEAGLANPWEAEGTVRPTRQSLSQRMGRAYKILVGRG